jgi:hypothetical protein
MAAITEVRFAHEDGALADTLAELPELDVRVIPETSTDPDRELCVFTFDNANASTVAGTLSDDHTVSTVEPMSELSERNLWGVEFAGETELMAPRVTRRGGFVVDSRSASPGGHPRGWHERWLMPDRQSIHEIWQHARERGFQFEVLDVHRGDSIDSTYGARNVLTDHQRTALRTAHEMGYFAEPREASLQDVADALGYSPSAVSGRLKRGLRSLIEATLVVDRGTTVLSLEGRRD